MLKGRRDESFVTEKLAEEQQGFLRAGVVQVVGQAQECLLFFFGNAYFNGSSVGLGVVGAVEGKDSGAHDLRALGDVGFDPGDVVGGEGGQVLRGGRF